MYKKHLPQRSRRKYLPYNNYLTTQYPPNIFNRKDYMSKAASGNRFLASQIERTAIYKDTHGNSVVLKEHETIFSGPKDMRGGTFVTPTKKIGRE